MPRPRRPGAPEPKRRSRKGCWPCKSRKVKCGEEKPICLNCERQGESCDYSVRLNWGGRTKRALDSPGSHSSGYGGVIIGFADSSPTDAVSSFQVTSSGGNYSSPTIPGQVNHFEQTSHHQPDASVQSPRQAETPFVSTWDDVSPLRAPVSPTHFPKFPFHASFSPVADQGVGLRSLSAFSFHSNSVSQQVSFLRNSVDGPDSQPDSTDLQNQNVDKEHPSVSPGDYGFINASPYRASTSVARSSGPSSSSQDGRNPEVSRSIPNEPLPIPQQASSSIGTKDDSQLTEESSLAQSNWQAYLNSVTDNYGMDRGHPDSDMALNNDHAAIDIPNALDMENLHRQHDEYESCRATNKGKDGYTGYYSLPVPINIPRSLAPLPATLLESPINLMYFHHFLNHTSRMLVPHDCDFNPFMSVLPAMAIGDPHLLNLLLAYSASHRARYLGHAEPANRIAHWVSDVFPALRVALESSHEDITDGNLATAILLVSLKIISPGTFEVPITWQSHLKLARELFIARSEHLAYQGNRVGAFFARWLGYIDTMGALSSRHAGPPLMLYHSVLAACVGPNNHDEFQVDCFTGFTPRTGYFLIRLAQLVQKCDNQRFDEFGNFCQEWHPSADNVMEAQTVLGDIEDLGERAHALQNHHEGIEYQDMMAIEEAFRCAGLLHLHRRVFGLSIGSYPVQDSLSKLIGALGRMRLGASTEVCALFPLFTAGCESRDCAQQLQLLERFFVLEKSGMKQIQNARLLMQKCWEDKLPWIALASGQFFG
ncbi:hypothetical protein N7492_002271 [Penicillium capsulatum]|uniref:Zn(2)-C6 fungal-type domain-containing protein n=1 Tax=Penicillium capsulatum TaxID=69766 RepID=A0A9W9IL40_9EURO|nr:hypothetical protein N7492_002271 [Penicillium capsulatum]